MKEMIWGYLLHLGYNMWSDREGEAEYTKASAVLRCDTPFWDELGVFMAKSGVNTCVIDLGEGVRYESHPELAVEVLPGVSNSLKRNSMRCARSASRRFPS